MPSNLQGRVAPVALASWVNTSFYHPKHSTIAEASRKSRALPAGKSNENGKACLSPRQLLTTIITMSVAQKGVIYHYAILSLRYKPAGILVVDIRCAQAGSTDLTLTSLDDSDCS